MTDFNFDDFSPDLEEEFQYDLKTLREKAVYKVELGEQLAEAEETVKQLKAAEKQVDYELATGMIQLGMNDFSLEDGMRIAVKDDVVGSFPKDFEKREIAKEEIERLGASDMIKTEVIAVFQKGEHNMAMAVAQDLRDEGHDVNLEESIHHSSYSAWGRELRRNYNAALKKGEAAEEPPYEKLGLVPLKKVSATAPKGKK